MQVAVGSGAGSRTGPTAAVAIVMAALLDGDLGGAHRAADCIGLLAKEGAEALLTSPCRGAVVAS